MGSRRQFVQGLSCGLVSAMGLRLPVAAAKGSPPELDTGTGQRVRIGIIGAENSHTVTFGKAFNISKVFPGVDVVAVWGETEEFAQSAALKGSIPRVVKHQQELLGMIDAVIIDHRHARYHGAAAEPFVRAGIPTFIDKPFTYRSQEARHILDLAKKHGTPITCLSSLGYGPSVDDMLAQVRELDPIEHIIVTGPAELDSKYGGIFFYGIHTVERLFKIFGDDVLAVRATRHGPRTAFQFKFSSGHLATAILAKNWEVHCLTGEGLRQIEPRFEVEDYLWMYSAIVRMFQTGEEPRSHESIFRTVTTLEAMERSASSERWEYSLS